MLGYVMLGDVIGRASEVWRCQDPSRGCNNNNREGVCIHKRGVFQFEHSTDDPPPCHWQLPLPRPGRCKEGGSPIGPSWGSTRLGSSATTGRRWRHGRTTRCVNCDRIQGVRGWWPCFAVIGYKVWEGEGVLTRGVDWECWYREFW